MKVWNIFPQRPSYHAQGWAISDHPEGKRYAHGKAQAGITVVTEARVADPGVSDQLNAWVTVICDMITEGNIRLQETSHLFLEIHEKSSTCNYYFADHNLRTIFWLQSVDTISVRLPNSFSSGHLRMFLRYIFTFSSVPMTVYRTFSGGKLLDSCRAIPGDRFPIFCGCVERTSGHFFACPSR